MSGRQQTRGHPGDMEVQMDRQFTDSSGSIKYSTSLGLIPLFNFGILSEDRHVYRSGQPLHKKDYQWLHDTLGVEDIIDLRAEANDDEEKAPQAGIKVWKVPVIDHEAPTIEQGDDFVSALNILLNSSKPVLIHCEHGHGRTSTFCVLAQLVMGMDFKDAMEEEMNKYKYEFHYPVQVEFLKTYYNLRFLKHEQPTG